MAADRVQEARERAAGLLDPNACELCGRPRATNEDWADDTIAEGEREDLCWGSSDCVEPDDSVTIARDDLRAVLEWAAAETERANTAEAALTEARAYVYNVACDRSAATAPWRRETATGVLARVDAALAAGGSAPTEPGT